MIIWRRKEKDLKKILVKVMSFNNEPAVELPDGDIFFQSQTIGELLMHLEILGLDANDKDGLDNIIVEFDTSSQMV